MAMAHKSGNINELAMVKVTGGELHPYLKDIRLFGRVEGLKFYLYGCHEEDEAVFYKGIFDHDYKNKYIGFESPSDVERQWMEGMCMLLVIEEFEVTQWL